MILLSTINVLVRFISFCFIILLYQYVLIQLLAAIQNKPLIWLDLATNSPRVNPKPNRITITPPPLHLRQTGC